MSLEFPTPKNFDYTEVFYFDDCFALIWGQYKNANHQSLGMRWVEAESPLGLGYPNIFGHGMWMVVPDDLAFFILNGISQEKIYGKYIKNHSIFADALRELTTRHKKMLAQQ